MVCPYKVLRKNKINNIVPTPCGTCMSCRVNAKTFLQNRIQYDVLKAYRSGFGSTFLGLSLNDDNIADGLIHKTELQKFFKRFRKNCLYPIKHYSIGEYGDQGKRPHYHAILIGCPTEISASIARKSWKYGFTTAEPVTSGRIRYVVDYLDCISAYGKKVFTDLGLEPPFALHSNGLGQHLFESQLDFIMDTGHYISRGKLYPVSEYWLNKLGVPISSRISFTHDSVVKLLQEYKSQNKSTSVTFNAWSYDNAIIKELIMYNSQVQKLKPKYGVPLDSFRRFNPVVFKSDIKTLSTEVLI